MLLDPARSQIPEARGKSFGVSGQVEKDAQVLRQVHAHLLGRAKQCEGTPVILGTSNSPNEHPGQVQSCAGVAETNPLLEAIGRRQPMGFKHFGGQAARGGGLLEGQVALEVFDQLLSGGPPRW